MLADCAQNRVRHFGTTTETPSVVITLPHKSLLFNFLDSNSCYRYEGTSRHPINFQYHPHIIQHYNGKDLTFLVAKRLGKALEEVLDLFVFSGFAPIHYNEPLYRIWRFR